MTKQNPKFYVSSRTGFPTTNLEPGAICFMYDTSEVYSYNDRNWMKLTSQDNQFSTETIHPRICTQCGAPLRGHKCEFCDTEYY